MFQKTNLLRALPAIILSTLLAVLIIYAWTEPSSAPPTGNVSAPLNVGSVGQDKSGALRIGGVFQTDDATFLARYGGNVGIGTTSISSGVKLEVAGGNLKVGAVTIKGDGSESTGLNSAKVGGYTAADLLAAGGNRPAYISPCVFQSGPSCQAAGYQCPPGWTAVSNSWYCISTWSGSYTPNYVSESCWLCQNTFSLPSQVTGLATPAGNTQVVLTWTAPNSGGTVITAYKVYRGTVPSGESLLFSGGCSGLGSVLTCTDTGLTNGTTYYYQVSAVNSIGEGLRSAESSVIPSLVPSQVTGLSATAVIGQVALNWTAPNNGGSPITNYKIYRSTTSGGETLFATIGNILSYTDTSVSTGGTTYYYKVSAVNATGEGSQSAEVNAMPDIPLTWSGSTHYVSQCSTIGGIVYDTGSGTICKYSGASVPSGWTQAANWQQYSLSSWGTGDSCGNHFSIAPTTWSNTSAADRSVGAWVNAFDRAIGCSGCNNWYWITLTPGSGSCSDVAVVNNPATNRVNVGIY